MQPLTTLDYFGLFFGATTILGCLIIMIGMPIMTVFFPKDLEKKIMRPPYFPEHHAMMLSHFPLNLQRTVLVTSSICADFYGKRYNGLHIARKLAPAWYRRGAYLLIYGGLLNGTVSMMLVLIYVQMV